MKSLLRRMVSSLVENDRTWRMLDATVLKFARYAEWKRYRAKQLQAASEAIRDVAPDLRVLHGPFEGMRYPGLKAMGSSLFPKLIGSYERELHPVIEAVCAKPYTEIVDIGSAEGYYAVGLAMRIPGARVFAFDTDAGALESCEEMAELNGVSDRLVTGPFCDAATLKAVPFTGKGLVIGDCEGYEKYLFTEEVVPFLAPHDVLIEVHDYIDIETSRLLRERFRGTHDLTEVRSIDDITKAQTYDYEELRRYSLSERRLLLGEERTAIMEWFYLTSRADRGALAASGAASRTPTGAEAAF